MQPRRGCRPARGSLGEALAEQGNLKVALLGKHHKFPLCINNIVMPRLDPGISAPTQTAPVSLKPL
jgi:hypothetical protein